MLDAGDRSHFPLVNTVQKIDFITGIKNLGKHREELIRMVDLNYSVFEKSFNRGKKVCLACGSYPPSKDEIKYLDSTIRYFGGNFDYYFKEHPRTIVSSDRKRKLENIGAVFLDPKIPTEMYMMINPDIYLAGYLSSAFLSIGLLKNPDEQILSIWHAKERRVKTNSLAFTARTAMNIEDNSVKVYDR